MAQDPVAGSAKADLLRDLDDAFVGLMGVVRSLPRVAPSGEGEWGAFEIVAHLDGWHLSAAGRIERIGRGEQVANPGDFDVLNAAFVAERAGLSRDALERQLEESFRGMRAAVSSAPDAVFWRGQPGQEDSLAYFIAYENGPAHYDEHMTDLKDVRP